MRSRRGMSLMEVLIVLAILIFMGVISYSLMIGSFELREALSENDDNSQQARVAMGRIRREVEHAFLTEHIQAINQYKTVFVGSDDNPDRLFLATLSHQRLYRDSRESDQAEITLWLEPSRNEKGYTLYHRESSRIDEEPDEDGAIYPLATGVKSFNLRYLDGKTNEWKDEWDTRSPEQLERLPRAVEVAMVLSTEDPSDPRRTIDIPYLTTILVQRAKPISRSAWGNSQEAAIAAQEEAAP